MSSFDDLSQGNFNPVAISHTSSYPQEPESALDASIKPDSDLRLRHSSYRLPAVQSTDLTQALAGTFLKDTTSMRTPIVIKGQVKKAVPPSRHRLSKKHRVAFTVLGTLILLLVTGGTLFATSPLGHDGSTIFNAFQQSGAKNLIQNPNGSLKGLIAQATATAVVHKAQDGYDPYATNGVTMGSGSVSLPWPVGQCTYWANDRYHQLTGYWVPWSGNADQWVTGAEMAHWDVSTTPHVPSIIVLMPGIQGASSIYGHVAVVEKELSSTTVQTSTMNWYADGGGFDIVSTFDFTVGSGVYFVWHP